MSINKEKIIVVCSSSGSAEILSAYIKENKNKYDFFYLTVNPAKKIFLRNGFKSHQISNKKNFLKLLKNNNIKMVLFGTGWVFLSSIELELIKITRKQGIKSVSFIDHWVNYRERFGYPLKNWKNNLPDEIWAGDKYAFLIAKKLFNKILPIKLVKNPYFKEIKNKYYKTKKNKSNNVILIISQPFKDLKEYKLLDEKLNFFLKHNYKNKIILKLHPSEKGNKYNSILSKYKKKLAIYISNNQNIILDINNCTYAIGHNSMGLVVADLLGKKAVSILLKKEFILPHRRIIKIKNINYLNKIIK